MNYVSTQEAVSQQLRYLDERIIVNITLNYPSLGDRLYRYDVAIDNEWENPVFIGNCFIGADVPTKSIDITDIVRNWYDFSYPYQDTEFQSEWQVRIWLDKDELEHSYSDTISIYPIYRYPNRKARMETPLSNNGLNWYIPALQGFNSDKKGEFLPHIPFVWSDKVDYNIAVNIGNLRDVNPYLYTGVKKKLETPADFGIYNTQYKLSELWKGSEAETIVWDYNEGIIFGNCDINSVPLKDYDTSKSPISQFATNLAPLQFKFASYRQINYVAYSGNVDDFQYYTVNAYPFDMTVRVNTIDYIDTFLCVNNNIDENYVNIYPPITEPCNVELHITGKYNPNNYIELVTSCTTGEITGDYILETNTVVADTFKIEIGKTGDTGDVVDRTFENITIGNTIEFDDTGDHQWLKLYDSSNTLVDTITLNATIMEEGEFKEYAFRLENVNSYLALYPLQQEYNFTLEYKTFINAITSQPENIEIVETEQQYSSSVFFNDKTAKCEILQSTGQTTYSNNIWRNVFNYPGATRIGVKFANLYGITSNNEVIYFNFVDNKLLQFDPPQQIVGLHFITIVNTGSEYKIMELVFKPDKSKYFKGFYCSLTNQLITSRGAVYIFSIIRPHHTSAPPYEGFPVASVDYCPARYYLQWRDRYGSMQMQPFCKVDTYTEDITRTEIKNYQDTRRLSNLSLQPKWKLNTKWLNNTVYPYYESLLVSPWIKMYDTKEDAVYDVIITSSDYTEKTFKNQSRQQFNLQIDVEAVNTQNIIY